MTAVPPLIASSQHGSISSHDSSIPSETSSVTRLGDSDGSSLLTSPIRDTDEGWKVLHRPHEVAIKESLSLFNEDTQRDVAYAVGGSESPTKAARYPAELDPHDVEPSRPGPVGQRVLFALYVKHAVAAILSAALYLANLHARHATAAILSAALYLADDKRIKGLVFVIIFVTVHSTLGYFVALSASITPPQSNRNLSPTTTPHHHTTSHPPPTYTCLTQPPAPTDPGAAQIGYGDHIPRWHSNTALTYTICDETFPSAQDAITITHHLTRAIAMWRSAGGVTFSLVPRTHAATFRVIYREDNDKKTNTTLATSFFPNEDPNPNKRTLTVYGLAFTLPHVQSLANVLAHEVGHILGLRHEFAPERERERWSMTWGARNPVSVMEYYGDASLWRVGEQDLEEVRGFYELDEGRVFQGREVKNFRAVEAGYPVEGGA